MKCARHEMSVFLHAHGQLHGFRRLLLESHLENCEHCRARWARWVVEKDTLRRTLAPLPMLDRRSRGMLDHVGAGIRSTRPLPQDEARRQQVTRRLLMGVLAALLGLGASAVAAYWEPVAGALHLGGACSVPQNVGVAPPAADCVTCHPALSPGHPAGSAPGPAAAPNLLPQCGPGELLKSKH